MKHQTNPAPYARELYRGTDVTKPSARPGAMDAYRLPSLRAGERVYPGTERHNLASAVPAFHYHNELF